MILESGLLLFRFCFMLSFFLNAFLCMDLYLTVKNPFYPKERRFKFYVMGALAMTLPFTITEWAVLGYTDSGFFYEEMTILFSFFFFVVVAGIYGILASKRILRPGVS